jgi:hypothetical protein
MVSESLDGGDDSALEEDLHERMPSGDQDLLCTPPEGDQVCCTRVSPHVSFGGAVCA